MAWKAEEEWGGPRLGMASISISFSLFHPCSHFPQPLKRAVVNGCQVDVLWGLGRLQRWQICHISLAASFWATAALHSKNWVTSFLLHQQWGLKQNVLNKYVKNHGGGSCVTQSKTIHYTVIAAITDYLQKRISFGWIGFCWRERF